MSRLNKLLGKPKEYTIGGETFEFKPLTVDSLNLFMDLEDVNKRGKAMKGIIKITLKTAVPDALPEEIDNVAIQHFVELSKAIMEVNGLNETSRKDKQTIS